MEHMTFEDIFEANKKRIHYHIHKLNIRDPHQDFYQEGLFALWNAYSTYKPEKGPMGTYFNFIIRNRLIDLIRKESREREAEEKIVQASSAILSDGNQLRRQESVAPVQQLKPLPIKDDTFWQTLKKHLTDKQWKWVQLHVIEGMTLTEIARQEDTSAEAVKSWGRQVRKKLRDETFRKKIGWQID